MKSLWAIILCASLLIISPGCGGKSRDNKKDNLVEAYRLIDEHRTEEAIALLESSLEREPKNREYRLALASAYAHYAGFKVQKVLNTFKSFDQVSKASNQVLDHKGISNSVDGSVELWIKLLQYYKLTFAAYSSIPEIAPEKIIYIEQAIKEISKIDAINQTEAAYRAVLRILLIKYKISQQLLGQFVNSNDKNKTCKLDISKFNVDVLGIGREIILLIDDMEISSPDKATELFEIKRKTANIVSDLTIVSTSVMVLDDVSTIMLKQAIVEEGFLKLLKCEPKP